jgi:hypothetical protein
MNDLPNPLSFLKDEGAPTQHTGPVIKVKSDNRYIACALNPQVSRLNIHIWRFASMLADLVENMLKVLLDGGTPFRSLRKLSRIKHGRIVGEALPELFPLQIVEGLQELG